MKIPNIEIHVAFLRYANEVLSSLQKIAIINAGLTVLFGIILFFGLVKYAFIFSFAQGAFAVWLYFEFQKHSKIGDEYYEYFKKKYRHYLKP